MTGTVGKREQTKETNRAALIEAARRCFVDQGYDAVTVRDIIRGTDLASGTFYNYFPDKETLFREILESSIKDVNAGMRAVRKSARSIAEFVRGAYAVLFHKVRDDPGFFSLILRSEHAARALFEDTVLGLPMRTLKEDIRDAVARGVFPDVDAKLLAAAFYGTGFEIGRLLSEQPRLDPEQAADFAGRLLTEGLHSFSGSPARSGIGEKKPPRRVSKKQRPS